MSITEPKICKGCQLLLPASSFRLSRKADGHYCLQARFVICEREDNRQRNNKNREKYRQSHRDKRHNLAPDEYDLKFKMQGGACEICHETNPNGIALANDHDHETGKNRGLLCTDCNLTLGKFKDNPEIFRKFADYLEKYK